jgi:iron complex transport system substrate-binding protein
VSIPAEVNRIVTLSPDLTETIYALGLEAKLVGDTDYCETPPEAKLKPHIGSAQTPSLEAIVALHPDLVLATGTINRRETADALKRLGIAVYTTYPRTVRGILESVEHISELAGAGEQGAALVERLQSRLDALHARLEPLPMVHVLFVEWIYPLLTIGQNTFIADALRWAGAESVILSGQNWPRVSLEEIVRLQPDYILLTRNHGGTNDEELDELRSRPVWKKLSAVERGHTLMVDDDIARPSPGLVNAIEKLARELHPEAFSSEATGQRWKFEGGAQLEHAAEPAKWGGQCAH